jgi:hypothetical protein
MLDHLRFRSWTTSETYIYSDDYPNLSVFFQAVADAGVQVDKCSDITDSMERPIFERDLIEVGQSGKPIRWCLPKERSATRHQYPVTCCPCLT